MAAETTDHLRTELKDTRDRLVEAITTHGPITAARLADRFGITSAAVRRHLAVLQEEGVIVEHDVPVATRGRGRPSKAFVIAAGTREHAADENDALARLALDELGRLAGPEALERLAAHRVLPWEEEFVSRLRAREAAEGPIEPQERVEMLAQLLTELGYATTVRPLTVTVPVASAPQGRPRTVVTAQLCQGHCPVQDVAAGHPELCEVETRAISRMLGVPVQRLATLAGGAHACTTHIPLTEGRTS